MDTQAQHDRQEIEWTAARIRRIAREAGTQLPVDYSRRVADDALALGEPIAVTAAGSSGVIIHTAPDSTDKLPVVIGIADATGQWTRDGTRHPSASSSPTAEAEVTA